MGTDESAQSNEVSSSSASVEMLNQYLDGHVEKVRDELLDAFYEIFYLEQLGGSLQTEMIAWRRKPPTAQHVQYILTNCDQENHELLTSRLPSLAEPLTPSLLTPSVKSDPLATGPGAISQAAAASSTEDASTLGGGSSLPSVTDPVSPSSNSSPISVVPSSESSVKISSSAALAAASAVHTYSSSTSKSHSSRTNLSSNGSNSTSNSNLLNTLPSNPTPHVPHVTEGSSAPASSHSASSSSRPQAENASTNVDTNSLASLSHNDNASKSVVSRSSSTPGNNLNVNSSPSIKPAGIVNSASVSTRTPSSNRPGGYGSRSYATRQKSISASFDAAIGNSQEQIVQKAQQEAQVMQRIAELRKQGIWSTKKLPKVQEPPREKAHWDFLLEEMTWLSTDFAQERKWKKNAAKKCALMIARYHKEKDQAKEKEKREELQRLRKIASTIAKEVRTFWLNVEKLVDFKQQTALEKKRKQVMDMHLNFIVGQTEQYTEWLTEGFKPLAQTSTSAAPSISTSATEIDDLEADISMDSVNEKRPSRSAASEETDEQLSTQAITSSVIETADDGDFDPDHLNSDEAEDDEETIAKADETENADERKEELACLNDEMNIPLQDLLPKEILEALGGHIPSAASLANLPAQSASASEAETASEDDEDDDDGEENDDDEEEDEEEEEETEGGRDEADAAMDASEDDQGKQIHELADALQPKGITLETATVKTTVPFLLRGSLREYQHIGLDWLVAMYEKKLNGILADEMGLGKTIQTIALLAHLACEKGIWGPHLIVVPTSVMLNWEMEFKKWCPAFKTLTYYGGQKERRAKRQGWTKANQFHVCITSYKLVIQDHNSFRRKKWHYLILDEAQHIKNFKSQRWQMLLNFNTCRRLLLTGTPLQNDLMELWSLMHFLMPNVFASHRDFKDWFVNPVTGMIEGNDVYNPDLVQRLHKVLRPFLLRRLKKDVDKQLPKKVEHVILCKLSKRQRYLYEEFMSRSKTKESLAKGNFLSVINVLMQLRKVCNHPNLFETRPITTPFACRPLTFSTASLAANMLSSRHPLSSVSLDCLNLNNVIERCSLPSYACHRIDTFKTCKEAIESMDTLPPPEPPIPRGRMKFQIKTKSNNNVNSNACLPLSSGLQFINNLTHEPAPKRRRLDVLTNLQLNDLPPLVSLQHPQASDSSPGQNELTTPMDVNFIPSRCIPSSVVQFAASASSPVAGNLQLKRITLKNGSEVSGAEKVSLGELRVSECGQSFNSFLNTNGISSEGVDTISNSVTEDNVSFDLPCIKKRRDEERAGKLSFLAQLNHHRCSSQPPLYPADLLDVFTINKSLDEVTTDPSAVNKLDNECRSIFNIGAGLFHCSRRDSYLTDVATFLEYTSALNNLMKTPEQLLEQLDPILRRFVIVVPPVVTSEISMHISHPDQSDKWHRERSSALANAEYSSSLACLHAIITSMRAQFPELRLIQYDCGKLQALDHLLRELKSDGHRVLLFTQMSRMLDIFEQFLNYHGHTYLRLDGATKIEQRQALMERFNADKRIFIFILSTRSGGVGVNLTGADTVIFYDSDWNPTMDAQAQDRCHRIGQTRDVHIYRLISERTVEENVLKKAQQKKLLADLAIEEGSFTTSFFRQNAVQELFGDNLTGQGRSLRDEMASDDQEAQASGQSGKSDAVPSSEDTMAVDSPPRIEEVTNISRLQEFEKALEKAEETEDVNAAKTSRAEAKAEYAEFDENVPFDDTDGVRDDNEDELEKLVEDLSPIEKYALSFLESTQDPAQLEELKQAEEEIEAHKKDWELEHLKSLKAEAEREVGSTAASGSVDEPLSIARDTALNQVATLTPVASDSLNGLMFDESSGFATTTYESMFTWTPPTPPQEQECFYVDHTLAFSYERHVMSESELPPLYAPRDPKRLKLDASMSSARGPTSARPKAKPRKDEINYPRSLFDRPSPALLRLRREVKANKLRGQSQGGPDAAVIAKMIANLGPNTTIPSTPTLMSMVQMSKNSAAILASIQPENQIAWSIVDEYHMLHVIQQIQELPVNLINISPAHIPNWDLVSDYVSTLTPNYRGMRTCRHHYESVVVPREEGKVVPPAASDSAASSSSNAASSGQPGTTKKKKKSTSQATSPTPSTPTIPPARSQLGQVSAPPAGHIVTTKQIYSKEGLNIFSNLTKSRIEAIKNISMKRPPVSRGHASSNVPFGKNNSKHVGVLAELGVKYDTPHQPLSIAAARLAKEKQRHQQQYQQDVLAARRQNSHLVPRQQQSQQQPPTQQQQQTPSQQVTPTPQLTAQLQPQASQLATVHRAVPSAAHVPVTSPSHVMATAVSPALPQTLGAVLTSQGNHVALQSPAGQTGPPVIQVPPYPQPPVQPVVLTVTRQQQQQQQQQQQPPQQVAAAKYQQDVLAARRQAPQLLARQQLQQPQQAQSQQQQQVTATPQLAAPIQQQQLQQQQPQQQSQQQAPGQVLAPHRQMTSVPVHVTGQTGGHTMTSVPVSSSVPQTLRAVLTTQGTHLPVQSTTTAGPGAPVIQVPPNPVPPVQPVVLTVTSNPGSYGQLMQATIARPTVSTSTVSFDPAGATTSYARVRAPASSGASTSSASTSGSLGKNEVVEQIAQSLSEAASEFTRQQQQKQLAQQQHANQRRIIIGCNSNRIINLGRGSGAQIIARQATATELQLIRQPGPGQTSPGVFFIQSSPGGTRGLTRIIGNIVSQPNTVGTTGEATTPTVVTLRPQPQASFAPSTTVLSQHPNPTTVAASASSATSSSSSSPSPSATISSSQVQQPQSQPPAPQ